MLLTDVNNAVTYIESWGMMAPLIAFVLFYIQAAVPLFPYAILCGAAGMVFGTWWGILIAWQAALWGAVLAYQLSRRWGKTWFLYRLSSHYQVNLEQVDHRVWFYSILLARLFPLVPTPVINIAAGISGVRFWTFTTSSALGKLPTAIIFCVLGNQLYKSGDIIQALWILTGFIIVSVLGFYFFKDRMKIFKNNDRRENDRA